MSNVCERPAASQPTSQLAVVASGAGAAGAEHGAEGSLQWTSDAVELPQAVPADLVRRGLSWYVVLWIGLIHVGALLALVPKFFSWPALILAVVLHWLSGGVGVCLGYHRLFTHGSFQTYPFVRYLLALLGGLAGEGSCLMWVANHRKHHAHSDKEGDPHSPGDGAWWSHLLWTMVATVPEQMTRHHRRWIPDLIDDRVLRLLDSSFLVIHLLFGVSLLGIGYLCGGWTMAISFVVWGMFVRLVFVLHSTWFVNSASHMWGYRNYETADNSRNNWWVAALTYGEGWHNNHHAYPRMARHGHRWWEIDLTFLTIRLLERLGLAWGVVDGQHVKGNSNNHRRSRPGGS